jgi:hypothetical protein
VMMGNRSNNAGVVPTIALSAHWRWVSTPQWVRAS